MPHVHNGLHTATKLQAAFRTALRESDPSFSGIERAGETITPTLDLWQRPEWALLRGEILYARRVAVAAAPATFESVELVNPAGSLTMVRVHRLKCFASSCQVSIDSGTALGAVATARGVALDGRYASLGETSICTVVTGQLAAAAALPQDELNGVIASGGTGSDYPYILPPGRKLFMINPTANTFTSFGLMWSEWRAADAELAQIGR